MIDPSLCHIPSILRAGKCPFRCQLNLDQVIALPGTPFRPQVIGAAADTVEVILARSDCEIVQAQAESRYVDRLNLGLQENVAF